MGWKIRWNISRVNDIYINATKKEEPKFLFFFRFYKSNFYASVLPAVISNSVFTVARMVSGLSLSISFKAMEPEV